MKSQSPALPLAISIIGITFIGLAMFATPEEYRKPKPTKPVTLFYAPLPPLIEAMEAKKSKLSEAERMRIIADIWHIDAKNVGNIHQLKKILTAKK